MDPKTRIMIKVTMEDAMKADAIFNVLMGDEIGPRRAFIEKNAKYVKNPRCIIFSPKRDAPFWAKKNIKK